MKSAGKNHILMASPGTFQVIDEMTPVPDRVVLQEKIQKNARRIAKYERLVSDGIPRSCGAHSRNKNRLAHAKRRQAELVAEFMAL